MVTARMFVIISGSFISQIEIGPILRWSPSHEGYTDPKLRTRLSHQIYHTWLSDVFELTMLACQTDVPLPCSSLCCRWLELFSSQTSQNKSALRSYCSSILRKWVTCDTGTGGLPRYASVNGLLYNYRCVYVCMCVRLHLCVYACVVYVGVYVCMCVSFNRGMCSDINHIVMIIYTLFGCVFSDTHKSTTIIITCNVYCWHLGQLKEMQCLWHTKTCGEAMWVYSSL